MNDKRSNLSIPILFALAVILGMFAGYKLHSNMPMTSSFFREQQNLTINEVMQLVGQHYVDKVNIDSAQQKAIGNLLDNLDPHSAYISSKKIKEVNEDLEGQFQGIGIEFNIFSDTVHVLSVLKDGPAFRSGLQIGDKITLVNDKKMTPIKNPDEFKKMVKGPAGSEIKVSFIRGNILLTKNIQRSTIPLTSIDAFYMVDASKGYIRLNRFSSNTYKEFIDALTLLKKKGLKKLILDLRDNGGGILEESVDIIDEFIGGNQLLVYTEGSHHPKKEYRARRQGEFEDGRIVVLINEGSASASEIIAGALQDLDRAKIIGRRSFGKGLVQEQYYLSDGSALRLTTARYYTPLGRSIQKPYGEGKTKYDLEILNRMQNENLGDIDSLNHVKKSVFKTKSGKILYGGGGINPDIHIAMYKPLLDSSLYLLNLNNTLADFAYRQFLMNQKKIKAFRSIKEYQERFEVNEAMISSLTDFAKGKKIKIQQISPSSQELLKQMIKALIARYQWEENGYYQIMNQNDATFKTAMEQLDL